MMDNNYSCLMQTVNLMMPVNLGCLFDSSDLLNLELDSHITILYARDLKLEPENDILTVLGREALDKLVGKDGKIDYPVFDISDLACFHNVDGDFLILKLKHSIYYDTLKLLNKSLSTKYGIKSDFLDYTPHITLAKLAKGMGAKYMRSEKLKNVLGDSLIVPEDLIIEVNDKTKNITSFHAIDHYFRLEQLKKDYEEIK